MNMIARPIPAPMSQGTKRTEDYPVDPKVVITDYVKAELEAYLAELFMWTMPQRGLEIDENHARFCERLENRIRLACRRVRESVL